MNVDFSGYQNSYRGGARLDPIGTPRLDAFPMVRATVAAGLDATIGRGPADFANANVQQRIAVDHVSIQDAVHYLGHELGTRTVSAQRDYSISDDFQRVLAGEFSFSVAAEQSPKCSTRAERAADGPDYLVDHARRDDFQQREHIKEPHNA